MTNLFFDVIKITAISAAILCVSIPAPAQHNAATTIDITTLRVATGLSRPVFATSPPADSNRLFIIEQHTGHIKILNLATGALITTPFLDINGLATGSEQGLLGLAFHPNYAANGFFYVYLTIAGGETMIRRYQVAADNPDRVDPASAVTVMRYTQPFTNHNGGWIDFGPNDGYLYIASGDGGSGGDPGNRAQDIVSQPLGKLLRIDVDGDDFPADPNRNYAIAAGNPFVVLAVTMKSGPTACAIPGGQVLTARAAICTWPT